MQPYLIFPGTCHEALTYYGQCLNGKVVMLQTYADSPLDVSEEHAARVFHSVFRAGSIAFMASDNLPQQELQVGTNFALFVTFSDASEQSRAFVELAWDGRVLMPLHGGFGMLEDRFKVRWILALETEDGYYYY